MCIICVSKKGIPQPSIDTLRTMYTRNPDGAGYMCLRNGQVEIHKGFMDWSDFIRQIRREKFTPDDVVVYHFRITTQAAGPAMTHPFPLCSDLQLMRKLDLKCQCAVAHNGIIPLTSNGNRQYSDTALFIAKYLHRIIRTPDDLESPECLQIAEKLCQSKLAIMDYTGTVATVGHFIQEDNGLLYSNYTYKPYQPVKRAYSAYSTPFTLAAVNTANRKEK